MKFTRRVAAAVLSLAGVALGAVALLVDMWSMSFSLPDGMNPLELTSTMWSVDSNSSNARDTIPESYAPPHYGVPVTACLVIIAVCTVLALRAGVLAAAARGVLLAVSGVFGGMVLAYVLEIERQERVSTTDSRDSGVELVYTWHQGLYALMIAAVLVLVGAGLAFRVAGMPAVAEVDGPDGGFPGDEVVDEHGVVIHQLGDPDEDTPPYGIALPHPDDEELPSPAELSHQEQARPDGER